MQLVHIEQETSWRDHGFVRLKSARGELIAECSDFQHNRFLEKSWERTVTLVKQALAAHPAMPPKQCDLLDKPPEKMPLSLRAKPDLAGQGNSSMHTVSELRQAQRIRVSSSVEQKGNQRRENVAPRPLRRSSSLVHSRSQSRCGSPLIDNGQQVLRSKGRSQIQSRRQAFLGDGCLQPCITILHFSDGAEVCSLTRQASK